MAVTTLWAVLDQDNVGVVGALSRKRIIKRMYLSNQRDSWSRHLTKRMNIPPPSSVCWHGVEWRYGMALDNCGFVFVHGPMNAIVQ